MKNQDTEPVASDQTEATAVKAVAGCLCILALVLSILAIVMSVALLIKSCRPFEMSTHQPACLKAKR